MDLTDHWGEFLARLKPIVNRTGFPHKVSKFAAVVNERHRLKVKKIAESDEVQCVGELPVVYVPYLEDVEANVASLVPLIKEHIGIDRIVKFDLDVNEAFRALLIKIMNDADSISDKTD